MGNAEFVKRFLGIPGIDTNQVDNYGVSALMLASRQGHDTLAALLMAAPGCDTNLVSRDEKLRWCTHLNAAMKGWWKNYCQYQGWRLMQPTALTLAVGDVPVVRRLLVMENVDANLVSNMGRSSLMYASQSGFDTELLLSRGAQHGWSD